jgi:hypothetical protein
MYLLDECCTVMKGVKSDRHVRYSARGEVSCRTSARRRPLTHPSHKNTAAASGTEAPTRRQRELSDAAAAQPSNERPTP